MTGIRGVECKQDKVYISGFYEPAASEPDQQVKSFVYKGNYKNGTWYELYYPDSSVTNLLELHQSKLIAILVKKREDQEVHQVIQEVMVTRLH